MSLFLASGVKIFKIDDRLRGKDLHHKLPDKWRHLIIAFTTTSRYLREAGEGSRKGKKKILFLTFDYRVHDYEQILEESWRGKWKRKQENPFLEQVLLNLARWAVNCFHRAPPPFSLKTPPLVSDPSEGVKQIAHVLWYRALCGGYLYVSQ